MLSTELRSPGAADLTSARELLHGHAPVTPLLESDALNELTGARLLFKAESLQRTGSYKFRGAYNRLARLSPEERQRGIVAFSTGNFGQAVACAARLLGIPAIIIVPKDAPTVKVDNCRAFGAEVMFYDRQRTHHREELAQELSQRRGLTIIPPGDDAWVIAGYGTAGSEILDQHPGPIDALLCPCGGGGLSAGIAIAFAERQPATELYTVEPAGFDDTARSLACGERVAIAPGQRSICDAILTPMPAELPFRTLRERITRGLVVADGATLQAMAMAAKHLRLVLEPAGAIAFAAVLSGTFPAHGKTVAIVCSGGNVDLALFRNALASGS